MKNILDMTLEEIYLDWVNNFLTIEYMAEYYNVSPQTLHALIDAAREIYNNAHFKTN